MEVAKDGVPQAHIRFTLTDHQGQVANLELAGLVGLERLRLGMNLNVLVLDLELGAVHLDFLVRGVLDDDRLGNTLTDWASQLESFNFSVVFHGDLVSVEDELT